MRVSSYSFPRIVEIMQSVDEEAVKALEKEEIKLASEAQKLDEQVVALERIEKSFLDEIRRTTRGKSPTRTWEDQRAEVDPFTNTLSKNFVVLILDIARGFRLVWRNLLEWSEDLRPRELMLASEEDGEKRDSYERLQQKAAEFQLNQDVAESFVKACTEVGEGSRSLIGMMDQVLRLLDAYFSRLHRRHATEGIQVHVSPIVTDLAILVFENIDAHGEIADGTEPDKLSAYSARKAELIVEAVKSGVMGDILHGRYGFVDYLQNNLTAIRKQLESTRNALKGPIEKVASITHRRSIPALKMEFDSRMSHLEDLDPNSLIAKDKSTQLLANERFDLKFKNETLDRLARMLVDERVNIKSIVDYVLERKAHLRKHDLEVNSFYVCRIGQGNPFAGVSAGQLEVVPGKKPNALFDDIIGSGFDEVGNFIEHIRTSAEWHSLYMATSPRKMADKANVLLIGPQGCGKTEVLRAVGAQEDSIAIFAVGSDFLTSWLGEAQKNPKRLFEAAVKLQKESDRHVHILIDEIDSVLNKERDISQVNLSLEFQMIMDGVVEYPHISVWGTTNRAERIPMPMIRRFAKVLIVGELNQEDRVNLLQYFIGFMPVSESYTDKRWKEQAEKLDGATGDVVRKVADHVWRTRLPRFINENPDDAKRMMKVLELHSRGNKFDFSEFDKKIDERHYGGKETSKREKFLREFRSVFEIEPEDVDQAIGIALDNVGIINEIETAKTTYAESKKFLAQVKKERGG
jgi:AAA+ superfamily predicted ATPase